MTSHKKNNTPKTSNKQGASPVWGGHYNISPEKIMYEINNSLNVDKRLYREDIAGSKAHAEMLGHQGIISKQEASKIISGLDKIEKEIIKGEFPFRDEYEDIHMNIEVRLKEIIGETAGKLHTARSRNDQVATDFRLWVRDAIDSLDNSLKEFQKAIISLAEKNIDTIMPGFTHLQVAQPITLAHHLMAYVEMIGRDRARFRDTKARLNESPLGAAALAGTSFPIDRDFAAKKLGFDSPMANSIDAVSDRDFAMEFLSACSISAIHLSRLAEEIVIWCSAQFKFITLPEELTTGSSIMPQKRNPDAAELVRAKSGNIIAALNQLFIVLKGLPLAYSKDMQEDKAPTFLAYDNLSLSIEAMKKMIQGMKIHKENMLSAAAQGYSTATDIADWLVQNLKIPFRESHHITGKIVKFAEKKNVRLDELSLKE